MNEQVHASLAAPEPSERIVHYVLSPLLPAGHTLAFNPALGTLSLLIYEQDEPRLVAEQQFTPSEVCVLRPLLVSYPHHCPYEVLHASFNSSPDTPVVDLTDKVVARSRKRLEMALDRGTWEDEMRPVRNVLSRTRLKLNQMHIDVKSILETGCILMPRRRGQKLRQEARIYAIS
ncbi:MAG: hypothetical protein WCD86_17250 [Ktedonobacteraceae bacterium]